MSVDIKFIAKQAGVSIATVSRVINNSKPVNHSTRERVLQEIEKYQYRPNTLARGLILNQTNLVGVVVPNVSDMYHAGLLSSIEQCAEQYHYNVIVSNMYSDFEKQKKSFKVFHERRVDGILLLHENTPEELDELCSLVDVPVVLANVNVPGTRLPSVSIDDAKAAYDAVSYLLRIGHRDIACIFGSGYSLGHLRKEGFLKALAHKDIRPRDEYILSTQCSIQGGISAMQELTHCSRLPSAIFCVSDEIAIGVMDCLSGLGYSIPGDVSVFGFDNIALSKIIRPHLSTVNQPVVEIGNKAMKLLATLMQKKQPVPRPENKVVLEHNLVLRDSCHKFVPESR